MFVLEVEWFDTVSCEWLSSRRFFDSLEEAYEAAEEEENSFTPEEDATVVVKRVRLG